MKKTIFFSLLFAIATAFTIPIQDHQLNPVALSELYAAFGIQPAKAIPQTQKLWLRKNGQERWEMQELSREKKSYVLGWARKEGIFDAWKPSLQVYDKALILGATTHRMQMRLDYLKQMWNQGVRFNEIIWLTGERPLDPKIDQAPASCKTESDAAVLIWEQAAIPSEMRELPVTFIRVPMKGEEGNLKRPNTEDTLVDWLKTSPTPGNCVFVSDQPFCGYQFAVIKGIVPDDYPFDVVGWGVDPHAHPSGAAITLDSIARWLYQEEMINKKK
jgi:hypothetical protein